jgi:hypothetical protein
VLYRPAPSVSPRPAHAAQAVNGDGSTGNPFTAPCDDPADIDCRVDAFAGRSLTGLWTNEYVPAYECPQDHAWLLNQSYHPWGTRLVPGVEVVGLGPVGVSISGASFDRDGFSVGTLTGFPNSSATNWTLGTNSYKVILHCTSDQSHGWQFE